MIAYKLNRATDVQQLGIIFYSCKMIYSLFLTKV